MPQTRARVKGNWRSAKACSAVLYHQLATGITLTELRFFSPVSKSLSGVGVSNLDNEGAIGEDRSFTIFAVAFDPIAVAAVNDADLLEFQYGEAVLRRNSDILLRAAVRAIGSVGGPDIGFVDAGSLGTTSGLNFDGGPFRLQNPELCEAGDRLDLTVTMNAAMSNDRDILASLLGVEVVLH